MNVIRVQLGPVYEAARPNCNGATFALTNAASTLKWHTVRLTKVKEGSGFRGPHNGLA